MVVESKGAVNSIDTRNSRIQLSSTLDLLRNILSLSIFYIINMIFTANTIFCKIFR